MTLAIFSCTLQFPVVISFLPCRIWSVLSFYRHFFAHISPIYITSPPPPVHVLLCIFKYGGYSWFLPSAHSLNGVWPFFFRCQGPYIKWRAKLASLQTVPLFAPLYKNMPNMKHLLNLTMNASTITQGAITIAVHIIMPDKGPIESVLFFFAWQVPSFICRVINTE